MKKGNIGIVFIFFSVLGNSLFCMQQVPTLKELCRKKILENGIELNKKNVSLDIIEYVNGYLSQPSKIINTSKTQISTLKFSHCGKFIAWAIGPYIEIFDVSKLENNELEQKEYNYFLSLIYKSYYYFKSFIIPEYKVPTVKFKAYDSESKIIKLEFSKCGQFLISYSADNNLKVWHLKDATSKQGISQLLSIRNRDDIDAISIQQIMGSKTKFLVAIRENENLQVKIYYLNINKRKKNLFGGSFLGNIPLSSSSGNGLSSIDISENCKYIAIEDEEKIKIYELNYLHNKLSMPKIKLSVSKLMEIEDAGLVRKLCFVNNSQILSLTSEGKLSKWDIDFDFKHAKLIFNKDNCISFNTNRESKYIVIIYQNDKEGIFCGIFESLQNDLKHIKSFAIATLSLSQRAAIDPTNRYFVHTVQNNDLWGSEKSTIPGSYSLYIHDIWRLNKN